MNPRDFLDTAADLAFGEREADWRSSVSRSYYAVYHLLRELFTAGIQIGLLVRAGNKKPNHDFIVRCLRNCDDTEVAELGYFVNELKDERHRADYELGIQTSQAKANAVMGDAEDVVRGTDRLGAARIAAAVTALLKKSPYAYRRTPGDSD